VQETYGLGATGPVVVLGADARWGERLQKRLGERGAPAVLAPAPPDGPAATYVVYAAGRTPEQVAALLPDLAPEVPIVVVASTPNLGNMVDLMRDGRVTHVMASGDGASERLVEVVLRLRERDLFGLDKFLPASADVVSIEVSSAEEKAAAIARVAAFAEARGVRLKYREAIEQAVDELLMNALYDAPVGPGGEPLFAEVPPQARAGLGIAAGKALLAFGCDGERFALLVRDRYGRLTRETVLRYIEKCRAEHGPIEQKPGGAGLGLYLIASASTEFHVHIQPGVATEAVCVFDLAAPTRQLKNFTIYTDRSTAPALAVLPGVRWRGRVAVVLAALLMGVAWLAWRHFR
jgi:hypothetical protein